MRTVSMHDRQECIPVGCVPPALYRKGGLPDREPPGQIPPGQKPPVDRQTPVKTLPSQTSFAGSKYST